MANPQELLQNPHRKKSGLGFYTDLEINLVDICRRGFEENPELSLFKPVTYHRIDPRSMNLESNEIPALFVWVDGSTGGPKTIGQNNGANRHSDYEEFFLNIVYVDSVMDRVQSNDTVKTAAHFLRKELINNLNLNDIGVAYGEFVECTFLPMFTTVDNSFCPVHNFSIRMIFGKVSKRITSRRR